MWDISPSLRAAYLAAHYRVTTPGSVLTLQVGRYSPELQALHHRHHVTSSAFLTAWNPYGEQVALAENRSAHEALLQDLQERNISSLAGIGVDPSGEWPGEGSLLALGISRDDAIALGNQYAQNALVWTGADCMPQLVLLT